MCPLSRHLSTLNIQTFYEYDKYTDERENDNFLLSSLPMNLIYPFFLLYNVYCTNQNGPLPTRTALKRKSCSVSVGGFIAKKDAENC